MNKRRILLVDNDQKNLKVLEMNFQASSYIVATAASNEEAVSLLGTHTFEIILSELSAPSIDGYQLLKEVQRNPKCDSTFVIFLSIKSDVWNRVKSLKLGAKDFIVKPVHVSEIVARVNMVQNRIESNRDKHVESNKKFNGRLEDLTVIDLIEALGTEKKTGILSLNNENGHSGQIVFSRGSVISAAAESLCAEEAIYKMIYWNRGRFSMIFTDVDIDDEFTISNMGLLLQGAKRMDLRNELLKQLPSLDAVVITTSNFKKIIAQRDMNVELKEFMRLFDGERSLGRIIDDSHENEIVTLKRIVKLYKLGFLHVLRDFSSEQPIQFKSDYEDEFSEFVPFDQEPQSDDEEERSFDVDNEIDKVVPDNFPGLDAGQSELPGPKGSGQVGEQTEYEHKKGRDDVLSAPETKNRPVAENKTHILMLSTEDFNNKALVSSLISQEPDEIFISSVTAPIYHGLVNFRGGTQLHIVSVNPNEQFSLLLDYFQEKTVGCIFFIDFDHMNWNYHRYLFKTLSRQMTVPILIIGKQSQSKTNLESHHVREKLGLDESHLLRFVSQIDENSSRRVLFTLLNEFQGQFDLVFQLDSERVAAK